MTSYSSIEQPGMNKPDSLKPAEAVVSNRPGKERLWPIIQRFLAFGAKRPDDCAKGHRPICSYDAVYKAANGDVFKFRIPFTNTINFISEFNECFRVVSLDQVKFLTELVELGLRLPIQMFCEAYASQNNKCRCCRLLSRDENIASAECGDG